MSTMRRMRHNSGHCVNQSGLRKPALPMKLTAIASRIRGDIQHVGVAKTAYEVFMRGINLCVDFTISKALKIEVVNPDFLESEDSLQWQFLDESQLFESARSPDTELTESFVQSALEKGDECYGAFDGEALACYGWYSNKPTDDDGLTVHFRPDYIYMYKGVTHPKYRGKRLHAIGMNRALREYLGRGFKGFVSTVDSHNFSSLRSVYRLGYQDVGYIVALKIGSHLWMHTSRGCREHGFFFAKPAAAAEPVLTA